MLGIGKSKHPDCLVEEYWSVLNFHLILFLANYKFANKLLLIVAIIDLREQGIEKLYQQVLLDSWYSAKCNIRVTLLSNSNSDLVQKNSDIRKFQCPVYKEYKSCNSKFYSTTIFFYLDNDFYYKQPDRNNQRNMIMVLNNPTSLKPLQLDSIAPKVLQFKCLVYDNTKETQIYLFF